ncbi:unnamed protein product [Prunus armeniaca]
MVLTLDACSIVQMSNLIRSCKVVTTAQSSPPPAQPSLASSMEQPVSAKRRHRPASTTYTTSTDATGASRSQPEEHPRALSPVEDSEGHRVTNSRINIGNDERHWPCIAHWPTTLVTSFGPIAR